MKNYAKVGNRQGRPGYRTPATFRIRQAMKVMRAKSMLRSPFAKGRTEEGFFLLVLISVMSLLTPGDFLALASDLPAKVLWEVPFTSQAPRGNWKDPRQQAGCEEASVLMAMRWVRGKSLSMAQAEAQIIG